MAEATGTDARSSIVEAVRTPIGRGHPEKGYYKDTHPNELLGKTYTEVIERAGIDASEVEDVITGCVQQFGEQMFNVGRNAWLQAGLPIETPATTVDRQCGSAQQAVNFAAALVASGVHDVVIGSGVEHMGHIPMGVGFKWVDEVGSPWPPELMEKYNLVPQGISAEMIADQWEIPRSELDEIGLRSHQRAHQATEEGRFEREIVPFAGQRRHLRDRPGHPARTPAREALRAEAGLQGGRQGHGGQLVADLRRRGRRAADGARRRRRRSASSRARGSSTRPPSAWTR